MGWATLFYASYSVDELGRTIRSVAGLLEFPSALALANQVRRDTMHTPMTLREAGALYTVGRLIERQLVGTQMPLPKQPARVAS